MATRATSRFELKIGVRRRPFASFAEAHKAGVEAARRGVHSRFIVSDSNGNEQVFSRAGGRPFGAAKINPGTGAAFARCVREVSKNSKVASPAGVCAAAGRKKYGAAKFAKMAQAGKRAKAKRKNPGLYESIKPGSRVTISNRFGQNSTGRAVMLGPGGWVLNMGGAHGTPAIASPSNVVKVTGGKAAKSAAHKALVYGNRPKQSLGVNRKVRKAKAGSAKQKHYERESYKRAYQTPGHGMQAPPEKRNASIYGTSHFVSRAAAVRYFTRQGDDAAAVDDRIREKSIHIGKPTLKTGEKLTLVDGGTRYAITSDNPARGRRKKVPVRRNSAESNAAATYEKFHGRAPSKNIEITTRIKTHDVLAGVGKLIELVVDSIRGNYRVTLRDFKGAMLAENPGKPPEFEGRQLFIEGGDQSVNLADFGIRAPIHELETLGKVRKIVYDTRKDHLGDEGGEAWYRHAFMKNYPDLIYDTRNRLMKLSGGSYTLPAEGIDK